MVFAAVPNDVTIEKLTAPEKRALDEYLGKESKANYFSQFLGNQNTPIVIGGFIAAYFGVQLAEDIIKDLEARLGALGEDVKQGIRDTVNIKIQAPIITTPGGKPYQPPGIGLSDFFTAFQEKYL